jgi:hypothetical protein
MDLETSSPLKVRIVGGMILLLVLGLTLAHAFGASVDLIYYNDAANAIVGTGLMMTGFFVVLGFGLTLAFFGENVLTAFFTVLYIVSATLLL